MYFLVFASSVLHLYYSVKLMLLDTKSKMRNNKQTIIIIERVSIECRKTKTKVITLANQKELRQSSKPIKTRSNYT